MNPLWKEIIFSCNPNTVLTLHCICSECELKQTLMRRGTALLTNHCCTLWASSLFEAQLNKTDVREFRAARRNQPGFVFKHPKNCWLSDSCAAQKWHCMRSVNTQRVCGLSKHAKTVSGESAWPCVRVCMSVCIWPVLPVKRRSEMMRRGGRFHSCESMFNTSLPWSSCHVPNSFMDGLALPRLTAVSDSCPLLAHRQCCGH